MSSPMPSEGPVSGGLQFERAEPLAPASGRNGSATECVACKRQIVRAYYHAQGQTICETCAQGIQSGQQAPPAISLARAAAYGMAAALAGCILYSVVGIVTGWEIGIIAIVVGIMVGKAVRKGSKGLGGRPQQVLAALLTYFAITTSNIPIFIHQQMNQPQQSGQRQGEKAAPARPEAEARQESSGSMSISAALLVLLLIAAAAPFLSLGSGVGAWISLFIIFIGIQRAWALTGRAEILIMGPYELNPEE